MTTRLSSSTIQFRHPFFLSGYPGEMPAGKYRLGIEEEVLKGLSFIAYRRTGTYLTVRDAEGHIEMCAVSQQDLDEALLRDRTTTDATDPSPAPIATRKALL